MPTAGSELLVEVLCRALCVGAGMEVLVPSLVVVLCLSYVIESIVG